MSPAAFPGLVSAADKLFFPFSLFALCSFYNSSGFPKAFIYTSLFTLNGYETLFDVLEFIQSPQNKVKIPNDLPLLFVAGDMDPVGNYGKSVKQVYNNYKVQGVEDIDIKLYKDGRHEILNELNYEDVYNDIYNWYLLWIIF